MRKRLLGMAVAAALVSPAWVIAPAAQAADCAALQKEYAAAVQAARTRLQGLNVSDADFRTVRDRVQSLGADGELNNADFNELRKLEPVKRVENQLSQNDLDLLLRLVRANNSLTANKCGAANTGAPATSTSAAPTSAPARDKDCTEISQAEAQRLLDADRSDPNNLDADKDGIACEVDEGSGGQVVVVPNDAPETGDGSTEIPALELFWAR